MVHFIIVVTSKYSKKNLDQDVNIVENLLPSIPEKAIWIYNKPSKTYDAKIHIDCVLSIFCPSI